MAPLQGVKLALRRHKRQHADRTTEIAVYRLMNDPRVLTGRIVDFRFRKPFFAVARIA